MSFSYNAVKKESNAVNEPKIWKKKFKYFRNIFCFIVNVKHAKRIGRPIQTYLKIDQTKRLKIIKLNYQIYNIDVLTN